MKKKVIILALSAVFMVGVFAVAKPVSAITLDEIQTQIQTLLRQVTQLQTQNQTAAVLDSVSWCFDFKTNLRRGDTGKAVANLHIALKKQGYAIDNGEINNQRFGDSTKSAVIGFQNKYKEEILIPLGLTSGTGVVNNATRAKLNQLYGCAANNITPTTTAPTTTQTTTSAQTTTTPTTITQTIPPATTTPSITIVSPNGGEKWGMESEQSILWESTGLINGVILYLTDEFGAILATNLVNVEKNPQKTIWKIPSYIPTGIYKITIYGCSAINCTVDNTKSAATAVANDSSDAPFSIVEAGTPSITVVSPNGGEKWQIGSMHTITWTPYEPNCPSEGGPCEDGINPAEHVTAMLDKLGSNNQWISVGKILEGGKASIHWDGISLEDPSGSYLEATPGDYYIRVVNTQTGSWDRSDNYFKLMPRDSVTADLKINGSDGPMKVPEGGKNYTASWTSNADTCYIYNNTLSWPDSFIGNLAPSGRRIIKLMPNTELYDKGVSLFCNSTSDIEGYAWNQVIILPSDVKKFSAQIISPNGGEFIGYNSWSRVNWNTTGVESVSLALYKNNKFFAWIVKDLPTYSGTSEWDYYWLPSQAISQDKIGKNIFKIYLIGKKSSARGTVTDISDKPFTISN